MNPSNPIAIALFFTSDSLPYVADPRALWNLVRSPAFTSCLKKMKAILPPIRVHAMNDGT